MSSASLTGVGCLSFVSLTGGRYLSSAVPPQTLFQSAVWFLHSLCMITLRHF